MPSLREIIAGYEAANGWELQEQGERLPHLTVEGSFRQYLDMWKLVREVSPETEEMFLQQRMAYYEVLHAELEKAARVMGRVGPRRL